MKAGGRTIHLAPARLAAARLQELLNRFADWWLNLPWNLRLVLLIGQAALLGIILFRLVLIPLWRQPDDDEVALMVEKARPSFRSRLIASLQLTRPGAIPRGSSPALVNAMVHETEEIAETTDFNSIISTERFKKFGIMAVTVLLIGILGVIYGGGTAWDLLRRAFLSHCPVPRKTHISVEDGDKIVGPLALGTAYPELTKHALVCVTELTPRAEIERFACALKHALQRPI